MAIEATVVEEFTAFTRMKKGQEPVPTKFKKGEKISLLQIWEGDLCLVKHPEEGKVFNIKKTYLNKEVFEKGVSDDKGKSRRKKAGDVPDYAGLSEIRPDLEMERGLAPHLGKAVEESVAQGILRLFKSKSGASVTALVLILAVYSGWQAYKKSGNASPAGQLASAVLQRGTLHKPGHFKPDFYALKLKFNDSQAEARVQDSLFGSRDLTLKVPGKKTTILANEQESRWLNDSRLRSVYYDQFVDAGSDGRVDKVIQVLEFWSDSNRLVGAIEKPVPYDRALETRYRQNLQKAIEGLKAGS